MAGRKAVWLGHAKRNKDEMMLEAFGREKNNDEAWWTTLVAELGKFDVTPDWIFGNAENRELTRRKFKSSTDPTTYPEQIARDMMMINYSYTAFVIHRFVDQHST